MSEFKLCAFADEADPMIAGQISALKENGIELIELRGVDGRNVTQLSADEMRELRIRLNDDGIKVWSIGSPIGKVSVEEDFQPHLELFRHTLELAVLAGAEKMRMFSFYIASGKAEQSEAQVIDRLGQMLELARDSGVMLCHENEKGIFGDTAERCARLHKALPELRAVYDPANFIQCGEDTMRAWEMPEPHIEYMHMKDAEASGTVVPAGEGIADIPMLLKKYDAAGGGVITLEPHLSEFVGLAGLEREGEKSGINCRYRSHREAFDAGVNALKALM